MDIKKAVKYLINWLENEVFAFIFVFIIMMLLYHFFPSIWSYAFAILLAYVIADCIAKFMLVGGEGIVQFSLISNKTLHKGHGYLAFILTILVSTMLGGYLTDLMIKQTNSQFIASLIISILLLVDYWVVYYRKK